MNTEKVTRRDRADEQLDISVKSKKKGVYYKNKFGEEVPVMISGGEFAAAMEWTTSKFSNYLYRGKLIEPSFYFGRSPFWSKTRVEEWINQNQELRGSGRGYGYKYSNNIKKITKQED